MSYELANSFDEERFLKMRIKVMHSGLNLNNSYFGNEAIEKAKSTLANIPILAFIKQEDGNSNEDFAGHEFEIKITQDDMKFVYLGRPIGIVPETNNYSIETDEDGRSFVVVDGYVWKDYANSALDIINRDEVKKVSMEVMVKDYEWEESHIKILDYSYTGIAMLGEDVQEAMIGAKAEVINYSKNTISDMLFELKEALKGGQENMEDIKDTNVETQEFENTEETQEIEETETETQEFENAEETEEQTEETEENFENEENTENENTEDTENFENENEEEVEQRDFEAEIAQLQTEIQQLQTENARLQEFVSATQEQAKEDAINDLFSNFQDLEQLEEFEAMKTKAKEMKLSEVENQLYALRGRSMASHFTATQDADEKTAPDWKKLVFNYTANSNSSDVEWAEIVEKHKSKEE